MINSRCEESVKCFNANFNCCQAVFATYSEQLGLNKETALKIASPFGGGIARMGDTCGAVTGALMLIGLKEGQYQSEDKEAKEKCYRVSQEFIGRFKELYGSIMCRDILSCDLSTESGQKFAKDHNLTKTLCPGFVRDASKIVEILLELIPAETTADVPAEITSKEATETQEEVAATLSAEVPAEKK